MMGGLHEGVELFTVELSLGLDQTQLTTFSPPSLALSVIIPFSHRVYVSALKSVNCMSV